MSSGRGSVDEHEKAADPADSLDALRSLIHERFAQLERSEHNKALILNAMTEGLILQDPNGRILEWNPAAERLLGLSGEQLSERTSNSPLWEATHPDGTPWTIGTHPASVALATGKRVSGAVVGVRRSDGSQIWLRSSADPIRDSGGDIQGVLLAFTDITAELLAERESDGLALQLRRGEEMARLSLDALEQGVVLATRSGEILRINPAAQRILGSSAVELASLWQSDQWIVTDELGQRLPLVDRPSTRAVRAGAPVAGEIVHVQRVDGTRIVLRVSCVPDVDDAGSVVIAFTDITAENRMLQTLSRYQYLFERANDLIVIIDGVDDSLIASPSVHRLVGTSPEDEIDLSASLSQRIHPEDLASVFERVQGLRDGTHDGAPFIARVLDRFDEWRDLELIGVSLVDTPSVGDIVLTARDMTERELVTRRLVHRANHDSLTELPNRAMFDSELTKALEASTSEGDLLALCYIDLDNFKDVNDTQGHHVGDELLRGVARVLLTSLRAWDTPARIGGDEFVVLLNPVRGSADALTTARRIREQLVELGAEFNLGFGASIGVSLSLPGDNAASLLRRADEALYLAKSGTGPSVRLALPPKA
jgi:diguanylate cyclase (GGDEF)-like protein/PAS domain S-box-containing protein